MTHSRRHEGNGIGLSGSRMPVRAARKPPHAISECEQAECAALGHLLLCASERDADAMLEILDERLFNDLSRRELFLEIRRLRAGHRAVDIMTVAATGKDQPWFNALGGIAGLSKLQDEGMGPPLESAVAILTTEADLRESKASAQSILDMIQERRPPDEIRKSLREIADTIQQPTSRDRPVLVRTNPEKHLSFQPPEGMCLVGDYDITKGYEGVAVICGPAGAGKSLVGMSLALAGAKGKGEWMGRTIHRQFRTMIVQAENGGMRMKKEFEAMARNHPGLKTAPWIDESFPPEGGLPFHRAEFRRAITAAVRDFKPDVFMIDPWTAVAADDGAKDVIDKLAEIRSCLPPGDQCPALFIIAHTRKQRSEGLKRGRGLLNELSGSLALGSTARTVYVLLPYTDDIEDDRVLWSCAKLSNGVPAGESVWHRRIGDFFARSEADPAEFWKSGAEKDHSITEEIMEEIFRGRLFTRTKAAEALMKLGFSKSAAYEALKLDGRFGDRLRDKGGLLVWESE